MTDWFPDDAAADSVELLEDRLRLAARAERRLQQLLGVPSSTSGFGHGPDVVLAAGSENPIAVELKITSNPDRFFASPSQLVSQTVRYRRQYPRGLGLVLVVLVVPGADDRGRLDVNWQPAADRLLRLTRAGNRGDGFDRVFVSVDGRPSRWWEIRPEGTTEAVLGIEAAMSRIRLALTDGDTRDATSEDQPPAEAASGSGDGDRTEEGGSETGADREANPPSRGPESGAATPPAAPDQFRVMLVADEWFSRTGGISTVNRGLATGLAGLGCSVAVMVPDATSEELDDAEAVGVSLVSPDPVPGISGKQLLLMRPRFDDSNWLPDLIVGHGRILGPYAYAQQAYFQGAKRAHIVHMDPVRLEKAKETAERGSLADVAEERDGLEVELAESAQLVAGIGATLYEYISDKLRGRVNPRPPTIELLPGLRNWEEVADPDDPPKRRKILLLGRAEDIHSKGIDVAVRAVKQAAQLSAHETGEPPQLVVRGVPPTEKDAVQAQLNAIARPAMEVFIQLYSTSERELLSDLLSSRVVLMPSRHEGFGLAALEAIAAGVPVRVTAESGLARFLQTLPRDEDRLRPREVLSVAGDPGKVEETWARSIQDVLRNPQEAYRRASTLRAQVAERLEWAKTARQLLDCAQAAPGPSDGHR